MEDTIRGESMVVQRMRQCAHQEAANEGNCRETIRKQKLDVGILDFVQGKGEYKEKQDHSDVDCLFDDTGAPFDVVEIADLDGIVGFDAAKEFVVVESIVHFFEEHEYREAADSRERDFLKKGWLAPYSHRRNDEHANKHDVLEILQEAQFALGVRIDIRDVRSDDVPQYRDSGKIHSNHDEC